MRELVGNPNTVMTRDTSYANRVNLAPAFFKQVIQMYEGTSRGEQEIMGMLLDSLPGALWTREMIRYRETPNTTRRVIGVDPSIGDGETSDECGIVGVGLADDGKLDVLGDWSVRASPLKWARQVVRAYHEIEADYIVIERNVGGRALLKMNLDQIEPGLPIRDVWAKESKEQRASNPALKYELGQVYHAYPMPDLEDQLCTWIPGEGPSPDRLDALVWAIRSLTSPQIPNRYGGAMDHTPRPQRRRNRCEGYGQDFQARRTTGLRRQAAPGALRGTRPSGHGNDRLTPSPPSPACRSTFLITWHARSWRRVERTCCQWTSKARLARRFSGAWRSPVLLAITRPQQPHGG